MSSSPQEPADNVSTTPAVDSPEEFATILPQKKSTDHYHGDNPQNTAQAAARAGNDLPPTKRIKPNPVSSGPNTTLQAPKHATTTTNLTTCTQLIADELMSCYRYAMGTAESDGTDEVNSDDIIDTATKNEMVSKALDLVLNHDKNKPNDKTKIGRTAVDTAVPQQEKQQEPIEVQPFDVLVSLAQTMAVSNHAGNKLLMTFCYQAAPHFSKCPDPKQKFAMAEQLLKKMETDLGTRFLWESSLLPCPIELAMTATCILIELMPTPHDVVFTQDGSLVPEHAGNEFFVMLCQALLIRLDDPSNMANFNTFIRSEMEKLVPPGRFLLADSTEFKFTEITEEDQLQCFMLRRILEEDRNNYRRTVAPPSAPNNRVYYHNEDEEPPIENDDDDDNAETDEDEEEYQPKLSTSKAKRRPSIPAKIQPGKGNINSEIQDLVKRRQRRVRLSEVTHTQYMKSMQNAATVEINVPELKEGSGSVATKRFKVLRKYNTKGKPRIIAPDDALPPSPNASAAENNKAKNDSRTAIESSKRKTPLSPKDTTERKAATGKSNAEQIKPKETTAIVTTTKSALSTKAVVTFDKNDTNQNEGSKTSVKTEPESSNHKSTEEEPTKQDPTKQDLAQERPTKQEPTQEGPTKQEPEKLNV